MMTYDDLEDCFVIVFEARSSIMQRIANVTPEDFEELRAIFEALGEQYAIAQAQYEATQATIN